VEAETASRALKTKNKNEKKKENGDSERLVVWTEQRAGPKMGRLVRAPGLRVVHATFCLEQDSAISVCACTFQDEFWTHTTALIAPQVSGGGLLAVLKNKLEVIPPFLEVIGVCLTRSTRVDLMTGIDYLCK
jgi:hypothetical protein